MADFHIDGDAGAIRGRTSQMRTRGQEFIATGDALAKISTDGWSGRAAEKFADKFDAEPERWRKAGDGFIKAASSLEAYADALEDAKRRAAWAKDEHARGDRETQSARDTYDADVSRARQEVADAAAQGSHMTLTILPFQDPGNAIRQGALDEYASAKADLEKAAAIAADGVRAGAVDAPAKRKWYEKIGAGVAGFLQGAGEAVWDLLTMSPLSPINMMADAFQLSNGDMTPEELAAKYRLSVESVGDMMQALQDDPLEFGKALGKGLLDWDTWADDPARALGHLVPDAVAAFFTAGAGTAVTRGVKGTADAADALSDMSKGTRALDDLGDLGKADDLGDLGKTDDLGDLGKTDDLADPSGADDFKPAGDPDGAPSSPGDLTNKEAADLFDIDNPTQDMRVWRVFGEAQDDLGGLERGSRPFGESWTPKDPSLSPDFRWDAGLPDENPSRFVLEGILRKPGHVFEVRPALPLDGNPGGWPEYLIRNADEAVEPRSVSGLNEGFTNRPGDWSP